MALEYCNCYTFTSDQKFVNGFLLDIQNSGLKVSSSISGWKAHHKQNTEQYSTSSELIGDIYTTGNKVRLVFISGLLFKLYNRVVVVKSNENYI